MRRRLSVLAVLAAVSSVLALAVPAAAEAPTATLIGVVTNEEGLPVPDVKITVSDTWVDGRLAQTRTDEAGRYEISGLPVATRWVMIEPATSFDVPYVSEWGDGTRGIMPKAGTVLAAGTNVLDVVLERGGVIEGTVTGEGAPLDATAVLHIESNHFPTVYTTAVIEGGVLRSVALPPGDYTLWVYADGWESQDHNGRTQPDMPAGQPLHVTLGGTTRVDLDLVHESTLTGRVLIRGAGGVLRPCVRGYVGVVYVGPPVRYSGASTDAEGRYRTQWGPAELAISAVRCQGATIIPTYHDGGDGAYRLDDAVPIAVPRGQVVQASDLIVDEAAFLQLRASYRDPWTGELKKLRPAEAEITVLKRDEAGYYSIPEHLRGGSSWTGWDILSSPGLTAGTYTILVEVRGDLTIGSEFYDDARYFAQSRDVTLEAGQTLDLGEMVLEERYFDVERIAGVDRYDTAAQLARAGAVPGERSPVVYLASGQNFPDALAASPAVVMSGGALLLTQRDRLPVHTLAALKDLDPERIVILGESGTVSSAVESAVRRSFPKAAVGRLSGVNRYATGRAIVRDTFDDAPLVFIATGANFPDALAAGVAAGHAGAPLILVDGARRLDAATAALLTELGAAEAVIVGGPGTVKDGFEDDLIALLGEEGVYRIAGVNRYETAALINQSMFSRAEVAVLATGENFPDALAAASFSTAYGAPVFLTPRACVHDAPASSLMSLRTVGITLVGGPGTLSPAVEELRLCG